MRVTAGPAERSAGVVRIPLNVFNDTDREVDVGPADELAVQSSARAYEQTSATEYENVYGLRSGTVHSTAVEVAVDDGDTVSALTLNVPLRIHSGYFWTCAAVLPDIPVPSASS